MIYKTSKVLNVKGNFKKLGKKISRRKLYQPYTKRRRNISKGQIKRN